MGIVKHGYLPGEPLLDYYPLLGLPNITVCVYLCSRCNRLSPTLTGLERSRPCVVTVPDSPFSLPGRFLFHILIRILKDSKQSFFLS